MEEPKYKDVTEELLALTKGRNRFIQASNFYKWLPKRLSQNRPCNPMKSMIPNQILSMTSQSKIPSLICFKLKLSNSLRNSTQPRISISICNSLNISHFGSKDTLYLTLSTDLPIYMTLLSTEIPSICSHWWNVLIILVAVQQRSINRQFQSEMMKFIYRCLLLKKL